MKALEDFLSSLPKVTEGKYYIWGTGNTTQLYHEGLTRENGIQIEGYIDNDSDKWGKKFYGKNILAPEDYFKKRDAPVLISSAQRNVLSELEKQVSLSGGEARSIDAAIFSLHKKEIQAVYKMLEDDTSRRVYLRILKCRLSREWIEQEYVSTDQYFALREFRFPRGDDVFVDCGAFVGDTVERYIWRMSGVYKKILAFEPDGQNFVALMYRIDRLRKEWNIKDRRIEAYLYGISDKNSMMYVKTCEENNGLGSKLCGSLTLKAQNTRKTKIVSLDSFFEKRDEKVTFLKADIEGYEYRMLLGAKNIIAIQKPRLAVCIYHNPIDMYSIPLLVKKLNPSYKISIRQHSYNADETVMYAY